MSKSSETQVVCFGGEDWWYHNRAHVDIQLMRQFSNMGRVLYVNSIVMRKFNVTEGSMFFKRVKRKLKSIRTGLVEAEPGFFVYSPFALPVHHIPGASALNQACLAMQMARAMRSLGLSKPVIYVACPAAWRAAMKLPGRALVYQRADRMEEYPGADRDEVVRMDRALKKAADVTFFFNRALYETEAPDCRRAHLLDHGVDFDFFASAGNDPFVPEDMKTFTRPVIGFFGGIDDHTSDIPLVAEVVRQRPQYDFVFIGGASSDLSVFDNLTNAHFLGRRDYSQIPHYGKRFSVAMMPWRQNRWIEFCNPIKLKEYLALGKPVVSTPFRELEQYKEVVYVAGDASTFAAALDRALADDDDLRRAARKARVARYTWRFQADEALRVIDEAIGDGRE